MPRQKRTTAVKQAEETTEAAVTTPTDPSETPAEPDLSDPSPEEPTPESENTSTTHTEDDPDAHYQIIIERGEAAKLSPRAEGNIYFQLVRHDKEDRVYVRIDGNDGGGLHSREWIEMMTVVDTLREQADKAFKSTLLKTCIVGKSANNASFLAAILRAPGLELIKASEKSPFIHVLTEDFEQAAQAVLDRMPE